MKKSCLACQRYSIPAEARQLAHPNCLAPHLTFAPLRRVCDRHVNGWLNFKWKPGFHHREPRSGRRVDSLISPPRFSCEGDEDKVNGLKSQPNGATIWTEADVKYTGSMILPLILRPWFVVRSGCWTHDIPPRSLTLLRSELTIKQKIKKLKISKNYKEVDGVTVQTPWYRRLLIEKRVRSNCLQSFFCTPIHFDQLITKKISSQWKSVLEYKVFYWILCLFIIPATEACHNQQESKQADWIHSKCLSIYNCLRQNIHYPWHL